MDANPYTPSRAEPKRRRKKHKLANWSVRKRRLAGGLGIFLCICALLVLQAFESNFEESLGRVVRALVGDPNLALESTALSTDVVFSVVCFVLFAVYILGLIGGPMLFFSSFRVLRGQVCQKPVETSPEAPTLEALVPTLTLSRPQQQALIARAGHLYTI